MNKLRIAVRQFSSYSPKFIRCRNPRRNHIDEDSCLKKTTLHLEDTRKPSLIKWFPPQNGIYKINSDGSTNNVKSFKMLTYAAVARDSYGRCVCYIAGSKTGRTTKKAELMGIDAGLRMTIDMIDMDFSLFKMSHAIYECDSSNVLKFIWYLDKEDRDYEDCIHLAKGIRSNLIALEAAMTCTYREANVSLNTMVKYKFVAPIPGLPEMGKESTFYNTIKLYQKAKGEMELERTGVYIVRSANFREGETKEDAVREAEERRKSEKNIMKRDDERFQAILKLKVF